MSSCLPTTCSTGSHRRSGSGREAAPTPSATTWRRSKRPSRSTRASRFRDTANRSTTPRDARELIAHHRERLAATAEALGDEPRSAYEVSFPLFGDELKPSARRFAVAETLSHLERLVLEGGARRQEGVAGVTYTAG